MTDSPSRFVLEVVLPGTSVPSTFRLYSRNEEDAFQEADSVLENITTAFIEAFDMIKEMGGMDAAKSIGLDDGFSEAFALASKEDGKITKESFGKLMFRVTEIN